MLIASEKILRQARKATLGDLMVDQTVTFDALWRNFPWGNPYTDSTGSVPTGFDDQCAIRVSVALIKSGVDLESYGGTGSIRLDGKKAIFRAADLADWIGRHPFPGLAKTPQVVTGSTWNHLVSHQTGIIFFRHYWLRPGEKRPTGNHIDLWNNSRLTVSSLPDAAATWGRQLGFNNVNVPFYPRASWSDLAKSDQILFWVLA